MKDYLCPSCNGYLMTGENVIFVAKKKDKTKGLILLHPEIGNYSMIIHPDFMIEEGEILEFLCPLCHKNLSSDIDDRLICILLIEGGKEYKIYFSRIAGEESTYKIGENEIISRGKHSHRYTYFKLKDDLRKYL